MQIFPRKYCDMLEFFENVEILNSEKGNKNITFQKWTFFF